MRYYKKEKAYLKHGEKRVIKRFAFLPISGNWFSNERRWLETVYLEQHYHISSYSCIGNGWMSDKFVERQNYLNYLKIINEKNKRR